ncbi:general amino acid permease AGP2 [Mycena floridula]|nr:general amino acid permease AGP2 [Mycena floridula]
MDNGQELPNKSNEKVSSEEVSEVPLYSSPEDHTQRNLKRRHIELIGIGGAIGTILFVQIGFVLPSGGPGSLAVAFLLWSVVVLAVNICVAEMVVFMPISSPYVRFTEHFLDPALGFCSGLNTFLGLALNVPYEIAAFNLMLKFWDTENKVPVVAVILLMLFSYLMLNVFAVNFYGECEFWLSLGKVLLVVALILFTFITMVGGNPTHDKYLLRNWDPAKVPGTPFVEYLRQGDLGRFLGFLTCLIQAGFTITGPEYISMTAGEAQNPRKVLPRAFNSVGFRLAFFFVIGAISVGTILPYNDPALLRVTANGASSPGAAASPYVIAMQNMKIPVFPHLVNLLIMMSIFSAGNSYFFFSTRVLLGMALEKKMPAFLTKCTKSGVPIYCVAVTTAFSLFSFLLLNNSSTTVLKWLNNLLGPAGMITYSLMSLSYIKFYHALKAQGINRKTLPYRGFGQPYCAYFSLVATSGMTLLMGCLVFVSGQWNTSSFLFSYTAVIVFPLVFGIYKFAKGTKWVKAVNVDFFNRERQLVDEHERDLAPENPRSHAIKVLGKLF